jgi:hypothetical protein
MKTDFRALVTENPIDGRDPKAIEDFLPGLLTGNRPFVVRPRTSSRGAAQHGHDIVVERHCVP